jgi:GTP diphosphokinase / guanosine-3',5'-bis(diphosphate) 3'-diphosphatase
MTSDVGLVVRAAAFAAQKHSSQRRKDVHASPYINHPLALADILANEGGVTNSQVIVAALLHDTVEDTETTLGELRDEFGEEIAGIVAEVTDDKSPHKNERKRLQVLNAAHKSEAAKLVKLADKISNLRDLARSPPASWSRERKREYFEWAREVVSGLRGVNPKLEAAFDQAYEDGGRAISQQ